MKNTAWWIHASHREWRTWYARKITYITILRNSMGVFLRRWMKLGPMLRDHVGEPLCHMLFEEHEGHQYVCLHVHLTGVSSVKYVL
jgi:hypothetical protein